MGGGQGGERWQHIQCEHAGQTGGSCPGGSKQDGERLCHLTQNGAQFKTYKAFISGIFHVIVLEYGDQGVAETAESETLSKWRLPYTICYIKMSKN